MSYLDPLGRPTAPDDWPDETGGDGRDARQWARHGGAAPDPYAGDPWRPIQPAPVAGFGKNAGGPRDPLWNAPTALTTTNGGQPVLVADPQRPRGPGRRRAGRSGQSAVEATRGRAGRNLPAAVLVGVSLIGAVFASLLWYPAFVAVLMVAASIGIWELAGALREGGARPPLIPLLGGGLLMIGLAAYAGTDGLTLGLVVTVLSAVLWRFGEGSAGFQRDLTAIALISVYVPFLLGFAALLAEPPGDGAQRVIVALAAVVLSDTGGYAFGVFLGKRKMAPSISPGKSWEGFAGSVLTAAAGSALLLWLLLDVTPWKGAVFGAVITVVAVLGDLAESMLKRDLGIKDMSSLLPGHGGLMDRLDSILFAVPAAYLLLWLLAPPGPW